MAHINRQGQSFRPSSPHIQLGTGEDVSVGELVDLVAAALGKSLTVKQDPARVRPRNSEVDRLISSPRLASDLLGWRPEVDLSEGLCRTIEWIEANGERFRVDQYAI